MQGSLSDLIKANEDNIAEAYTALYSGWDEALAAIIATADSLKAPMRF